MFADLDDPAPPLAGAPERLRVDHRASELVAERQRSRRRARAGLIAAIVVFVVVVGTAVVVVGSRSDRDRAPATPTGDRIVTWSFAGSHTPAAAQETVARLNRRFAVMHLHAQATLSDDQVVVTAPPGEHPTMSVLLSLAQEGRLEFRPVFFMAPEGAVGEDALTEGHGPALITVPQHDPLHPDTVVANWLLGPVILDGSAVESAGADFNQAGQWEVRPVLRPGADGIDKFNAAAAVCYAGEPGSTCPSQPLGLVGGKGQIAVVFDGDVVTAPTIDAPEFDRDQITISSDFTQSAAERIAAMLDSGALPARLDLPPS